MEIEYNNFLQNLQPYNVGLQHIRLGNKNDGGYVVPLKCIINSDVFYTFGVGSDISFEEDVNAFIPKTFNFFDHTISSLPINRNNYKFFKKGLGISKNYCHSYDYFVDTLNNKNDKIFLKIDIEGGELDGSIEQISDDLFSNITCLVVEIHYMENLNNIIKYNKICEKLKKHFILTHIHFNNWGKKFIIKNYTLSNVIELTFTNIKLIEHSPLLPHFTYPIYKLDFPNIAHSHDIPISFIKQIGT